MLPKSSSVLCAKPRGNPLKPATAVKSDRSVVNWVSIVGTRPQFVKLDPVCRAVEAHNQQGGHPHIEHRILHTGQHYDREVSDLFFSELQLPEPHYKLAAGSGSPGSQLARMLARMEHILASKHINQVIVYGDTNSTLAGALLAARLKLPIAHVEAGCRSRDVGMPEEQNRIVADHLSQLLLAPSKLAMENLLREGIGTKDDPRGRRAVVVGDVMYDALLQHLPFAEQSAGHTLEGLGLERGKYYLLTIHRAENTNSLDRLRGLLEAAGALDLPVLFPIHPRTRHILESARISVNGNICPVAPLGYLQMLALAQQARKILTDSGGVQKEAFYLGVPCITLRDQTEWPETVALGANRIAGTSSESIREAVAAEQSGDWKTATPYGDGSAARNIVRELLFASDEHTTSSSR